MYLIKAQYAVAQNNMIAVNKNIQETSAVFAVGDSVEESGVYICVPCGDKHRLDQGAVFPSCLGCVNERDKNTLTKGLELWEKIDEEP